MGINLVNIDIQNSSTWVLIGSIFITGLLGSWHCGVMCGPMATYLATQKRQLAQYHLGRLISYCSLGSLFGHFSYWLINTPIWMRYTGVIFICLLLITNFILNFFSDKLSFLNNKYKIKIPRFLNQLYFKNIKSGFLLGLFSIFLPCGWLYTFIVSALAAKSATAGLVVMFIFWISTLPALTTAQLVLKKIVDRSDMKSKKVASIVLLCAGLYSLLGFIFFH